MYPAKVRQRLDPTSQKRIDKANAAGLSPALECGTFVEFTMDIEPETKVVRQAGFRSNGCGYMLAAADVLASFLRGKCLTEMHGFNDAEILEMLSRELGPIAAERRHCLATCIDALRETFRNFRDRQIEEFAGEKPLICTCFGITEEAVEAAIRLKRAATVDDVGRISRAGTGCGSCRMLIEELIDIHSDGG